MGKQLFIAEKPSVAAEFAKALKVNGGRRDGYLESDQYVVTWCVGHLITMSYPEVYDPALKKWSLNTIPFFPEEWKYEVIGSVKKQFTIVKGLLNRADVDTIYICTDSGREGEYIYRLVDQMAGVKNKKRLRVWIDSQTEEEILRGIREAKDWSFYDHLSDSAYLRAKEDYLMGINFSRALTLKFGPAVASFMNTKWSVISVGRVMTCVLGMVVRREREIRSFVKTPFYRVIISLPVAQEENKGTMEAEWRSVEGSKYFQSPKLYKENGFLKRETAQELISYLEAPLNPEEKKPDCTLIKIEKKKEQKQPPLLFNLAELQNTCSRRFKISPDETLKIVQELYEKKMVTYPRTDARVLSTAVCKEIYKNIGGLRNYAPAREYAQQILDSNMYKGIEKTRYCNDKAITDHYAIIPTGQGFGSLSSLSSTAQKTYEIIVRRFLSIFYPAAIYQKVSITSVVKDEQLYATFKVLVDEGYLKVAKNSFGKNKMADTDKNQDEQENADTSLIESLKSLKKGSPISFKEFNIKEGETSPPKRYNSGSIILAMENAGQLIEDEELRAQIKGSGIGTSATRAEILKKLNSNQYIFTNTKTQIITPTLLGEIIYDVVDNSIKQLLNPELTASWEKGLTYVAEGSITADEYMQKLSGFVGRRTLAVKDLRNQAQLVTLFNETAKNYK